MSPVDTAAGMGRRRLLMGGVAAAAASGGAWWAWRSTAAPDAEAAALQAFWALELAQPDGTLRPLAHWRGQPLLVNFWATWCPPCVRELPLLNRFAQEQAQAGRAGIQVLGIAVDQAAAVNKWLARQPLDFAVVLAGAGGVALSRSLGNRTGGLPFTILLDSAGKLQQRKIGELSEQDLAQWRLSA